MTETELNSRRAREKDRKAKVARQRDAAIKRMKNYKEKKINNNSCLLATTYRRP